MPNTNKPEVVNPYLEGPLSELLKKQIHLIVDLAEHIKDVDRTAAQLAAQDSWVEPLKTLYKLNQEEEWQQVLNAVEKRFYDLHNLLDQVYQGPCPNCRRKKIEYH